MPRSAHRLATVAAIMTLLLCGCGSGGSTTTSESAGSPSVDSDLLAMSDVITTAMTNGSFRDANGRLRDASYPSTSTSSVDRTFAGDGGGSMQIFGVATVTVYIPGTESLPELDCRATLEDYTPVPGGASFTTLPKRPLRVTGSLSPSSDGVTITGPVSVLTPDFTVEDRVVTIIIHPIRGITLRNEAFGATIDPGSY